MDNKLDIKFKYTCSVVSILFLLLCLTLLFIPEAIYWLFTLQQNELGDFLAKRAGVLFLGFSILCFLAGNSVSLDLHIAVSLVVGTAMSAMALVGTYEFIRGFAGLGMLLAIVVEVLMAAIFLRFWSQNRMGLVG